MRLRIQHILLIISFLMLVNTNIKAQLYAVGASKDTLITYKSGSIKKIKLYTYNLNENNLNSLGKLKAISPDSTKGWTFNWFRHQTDSVNFDTLGVYTDVDSMFLDNLTQGCYIVKMTKNSVDTSFYVWIILNKLRFHLYKTNEGFIDASHSACEWLDLVYISKTNQRFDSVLRYVHEDIYYLSNPETQDVFTFQNNTFASISSKDTSFVAKKPSAVRITRIEEPPAEDTKYTVIIQDVLGNSASDEIIYKTKTTKADFKMFIAEDTIKENALKNYKDVSEGEAMLWGKFINTSKNGINFEWRLADSIFVDMDSVKYLISTTDSTDTVVDVLYNNPYKYKVMLISTSPKGCTDSITKELTVLPSKIGDQGDNAFPKYFTPGGEHPNFGIKDDSIQSIRYIRLCIYNNRGNQIYEYKGKIADGWKGWDGTTKWGDAPAGIYYYYFEAEGWGSIESNAAAAENNDNTKSKASRSAHGKGYFYLFRSSN